VKFLGRCWRLVVLAFCFATFGIGGPFIRYVLFPLMSLFPGWQQARQMRARRVAHACFAAVIRTLRMTGTMTLELSGVERLHAGGQLILANHPSYLDVVTLLGLAPTTNCVVKQALWENRYFGGVVRHTGYVSNSDPDRLVDDCAAVLKAGQSLLVFPEGTRTVPGEPLRFQRGAARIALRSGSPILPVIMTCVPAVWAKGFKLWSIAEHRFHIRVEVQSAVKVESFGIRESADEARMARELTRQLEAFFLREITRHEQSISRATSGN
jgi:1-acyl-sn-glycerol-3-phosphate acyltransferase